jgi:site-specific recombinase XerD
MQRLTELGTLEAELGSWTLHLEAGNKSPKTIVRYTSGVTQFAEYLRAQGRSTVVAEISPSDVAAFMAHVLQTKSASTADTRYRDLQAFFKWQVDMGELGASPVDKVDKPRLDEKPVPVISQEHLEALFRACRGPEFVDRRDTAILSVFVDTGARLGEVAGLKLDDVYLGRGMSTLYVTGKGRVSRQLAIGRATARDLDRYNRLRSTHRDSELEWLWIGERGRLHADGIADMIERRCRQAGIPKIHPHKFRHTFAHQWLAGGGQEGDLQALAGWKSAQMVSRYGRSMRAERAREAHRRLSPRDKLG